MEQGELHSSPEVEIEFGTADSNMSDEGAHSPEKLEVEEALDIKPPQVKIPKKKDKHKHKHDKKRSAEKERRRDKHADRERSKHDRSRPPKELMRDRREHDRREKSDRDSRPVHSEVREPVLDAREKIREQRELREAREQYDKRGDMRDVREVIEVRDKQRDVVERSRDSSKDQRIVQDTRAGKDPRRDAYRDQDVYMDAKERERGDRDRDRDRDRERDFDDHDRPREKKVKSKKEREEELKRREKSRVERERLESLEMERRRLERQRQRQEQEIREKHARQTERERDKRRMEEKRKAREELDRRRGGDKQEYRQEKRTRSETPPTRRGAHMTREEVVKRRKHDELEEEEEEVVEVIEERPLSSMARSPEVISGSGTDSSEDDEDDSGSESDSSSGTTASEQEEEEEDAEANGKSRSKFDDEHPDELHPSPVLSDPDEPLSDDERYNLADSPPSTPEEDRKPQLPPYYPAIEGCRNVDEFLCLNRIEEGTYGVVYRAKDKKTSEIVALKRLKMEKEKEGFPITSLREVNTLLKAQHVNIVTVREIVVGSNMDKIYIVMDYVEHDLKSLIESMKEPFMIGEVKTLLMQLLAGVAHLHDNWIIHRDLKTSNLLLSHKGVLKIGDFGLAREYGSPLKQYTPVVVTLWYRSPELLLGTKEYSTAVDMWSVGCIFAELILKAPLFPGKSEIDQLNRIFKELGTPNEKIWQGVSELPAMKKMTFTDYPYNRLRNRFGTIITERGFNLMNRFLTYSPSRRVSAIDGLKDEYFTEAPLPVDPAMFPTWPAKSELSRKHGNTPKPPSGGMAFNKLLGDDDLLGQGFHLNTSVKGGTGFSLKF